MLRNLLGATATADTMLEAIARDAQETGDKTGRPVFGDAVMEAMRTVPRAAFVPEHGEGVRLREQAAPHRPRPDHLAALHRRPDDRASRCRAGRAHPGGRHRLRLPDRRPLRAGCHRPFGRGRRAAGDGGGGAPQGAGLRAGHGCAPATATQAGRRRRRSTASSSLRQRPQCRRRWWISSGPAAAWSSPSAPPARPSSLQRLEKRADGSCEAKSVLPVAFVPLTRGPA